MKVWKYDTEEQLDRDIAFSYYGLLEGLKETDESLILRNLSIDLYEKYRVQTDVFAL